MMTRITGQYVRQNTTDEQVQAFIPYPLPPRDPPLQLNAKIQALLHEAEQALIRLDLAGDMVPSLDWFLYAFVRKEAVLSSQIEGTQATLVDLIAFEAQPAHTVPNQDVEEVCNYITALTYAREQLSSPTGLPLSNRLLNETHKRLMAGVRGANKLPGEMRRSQNWIGGTRPGNAMYVPPPPQILHDVMGDFERYFHADDDLHPLLRAGLLHVQFETIHPYLDGNGRLGRLLVSLLLEHWGLLKKPLLYLSLYFKRYQTLYYQHLNIARTDGDWERWLIFFLEGVITVANEATQCARSLFALVGEDRIRLMAHQHVHIAALRLFELLPRHPLITVASGIALIHATKPTVGRAVDILMDAGILVETSGRKRDRIFSYQRYIDVLRQEVD